MGIYQTLVRPLVFQLDPEWVHGQSMGLLEFMAQRPVFQRLLSPCQYQDPVLAQKLWGINFANPLGLAAGFDKHGQGVGIWEALGFGWAEIGTVTRYAQPGNPPPRLFRLIEDEAVINRMGFNNAGAEALAKKLMTRKSRVPLGINLGKSKSTDLAQAPEDYAFSFQKLYSYGDYFVINVSSPNTAGLRDLQKSQFLSEIFQALQERNRDQKPLLVKIAPDLETSDLEAIVRCVQDFKLAGIIATNTTIQRPPSLKSMTRQETGGLSGVPLTQRSTAVLALLWQISRGTVPLVGVGGITTAEDAWDKIIHGASLLQIYTGWIYQGPLVVPQILRGLAARVQQAGLSQLSEAVGMAHR